MRKIRSDSKLLNLPEEQQAKLADWLLDGMPYHEARVQVEKEFGVVVSLRAFSDFWHEVCAPALIQRRRRAVLTAEEVASEASNIPGRFDQATVDALKQQAFELAIRPNANPKDIHSLFSLVLKADEQARDERKMAQVDRQLDQADRKIKLLEEKSAEAKARLTEIVTKGGLTPDTLKLIEEAAAIL